MIPSILTTLALVAASLSFAGQILFSQITSNAAFVNGSQIISGHMFWLPDSSTTTSNSEYVGLQQTVKHTAGGYDFITNGTQSGVVLKDNGVTAIGSYTVNCTATGGSLSNVARYDTCYMPPLLSTTGAIVRVSMMISASPTVVGFDCSFVKGIKQGTGTVLHNTNNFQSATGTILNFGTGSLRWNSADSIACKTLTDPTASFAAKLKVDYFDDTSE